MSDEPVFGWHFTDGDKLRDGRPLPAVGEWLYHEGPVVICKSGLHGSRRVLDALKYAPGNALHYCEFAGVVDEQDDKLVARRRRIVWSIDAEDVLRAFARRVALDMSHLWATPGVVREYLETGREGLRSAAMDAAWSAAMDAESDGASTVAWAAASDVAWVAASDVAWVAASDVAWVAARAAARAAARDAAWSAARGAAWSAAWSAARDAARPAAFGEYNRWLTDMVEEARDE